MSQTTEMDLGQLYGPYSDRQMQETMSPIEGAAVIRRSINGTLLSIGDFNFRKYGLSVSGTDVHPPNLGDVFPGDNILITPISRLNQRVDPEGGSDVYLHANRSIDESSVMFTDLYGREVSPAYSTTHNSITLISLADPLIVSYRPRLSMIITSWNMNEAEKDSMVSWSFEAEEV